MGPLSQLTALDAHCNAASKVALELLNFAGSSDILSSPLLVLGAR